MKGFIPPTPGQKRRTFFFVMIAVLLLLFAGETAVEAKKKARVATEPAFLPAEQNKLLKEEILGFARKNRDRDAGEGWLYLARHFQELKQPHRSLIYLRTLLRSDPVAFRLKCEAQLLVADIHEEQEDFDKALKELDRLLTWEPERDQEIRAYLARAQLLGRTMTKIEDLFKAYKRYFWYFPEIDERESLEYLMGFERGYDLEIGMRALEAWEKLSAFPEKETAETGLLHIGLLHAYDLNNADRGLTYLNRIASASMTEPARDAHFVQGALHHLHRKDGDPNIALSHYRSFLKTTKDLLGYRVATILTGRLLTDRLGDHDSAIEVFSGLASTPPHLTATPSFSLERREEVNEEERVWGILALKMAGYVAEFSMKNPDRARLLYTRAQEIHKLRRNQVPDSWLDQALARTEPQRTEAQLLFEMAYEKYRGRDLRAALATYEQFIASYPRHELVREALFRAAVITNDELKDYDSALERYQRFLLNFQPRKSTWQLDTLYDWGRTDEVRYRIGNLLAIHKRDPIEALKVFDDLVRIWPDSYWALQGMLDSIRILREDMGDENSAILKMQECIKKFPDSKEAQDLRKNLFNRFLGQGEFVAAITLLREYLDFAQPSEEGYLELKQQWRDLSFRMKEGSIRANLPKVGTYDQLFLYEDLIKVMALASSTQPLKNLVVELKEAELADDHRWRLLYRTAAELYQQKPGDARELLQELAGTASGGARLVCLLSLGNIAYRVDKSIPQAIKWYEEAASLTRPLHPLMETPRYRLGRLYLAAKEGLMGMETLQSFIRRYPQSRHVPYAMLALADACQALHHPEQARRYLRRITRLAPQLGENVRKRLEELEGMAGPKEWLKEQADLRETERRQKARLEKELGAAADSPLPGTKSEEPGSQPTGDISALPAAELYASYLEKSSQSKPDVASTTAILIEILGRRTVPAGIREKALKHFVSWRLFRSPDPKVFVPEAQKLLTSQNYAPWQGDLLYRLAFTLDRHQREYEAANKAYFEYLSFYPDGVRNNACRQRIPQVYAAADDPKNAFRFFDKLIEDSALPPDIRVDAAIRKAIMQEKDQKKDEAILTLESALAFPADRTGEICLRLERLTDNADYIRRALESEGQEEFRFKALKRLIRNSEKDQDFPKAAQILDRFRGVFTEPEAMAWVEKKREDLGKRGVISEIEHQIEFYPEEPETPQRLFRLAKLVEGAENTKYRSQDLFYEITLVYPQSPFFRESKIRADNTRAINTLDELSTMLKSGKTPQESEEILLERARILENALKDREGAEENYEALLALGTTSPRRAEALLGLGDISLKRDRNAQEALQRWEEALATTRDPELRHDLTTRINDLRDFQERILYSEDRGDHQMGEQVIFRIWRIDDNPELAISMLEEALSRLENRPHAARFHYLLGLIQEHQKRDDEAFASYEKALRSLYHPGLRKDRCFYRMARIRLRQGRTKDTYALYEALIRRYPRSRLSRSAYYWLHKVDRTEKRFTLAHHRLTRLLHFTSLMPVHRTALVKVERELAAEMAIHEMTRLRQYSKSGGSEFPYYVGKVLENDLRDYDRAIRQYETYLTSHPTKSRSRDLLLKIAELYEKKGDYVKSVNYLDTLLHTEEPDNRHFPLILRMGDLVEDKLANPELAKVFYESVEAEYRRVPRVRRFAMAKLRSIEASLKEKARPAKKRAVKREYSEEDEEILEELTEIKEQYIDDLQNYEKAEREMLDLWDANPESPATFDIMKELVALAEGPLVDPQKAGEYYERWLGENPSDPAVPEYTLKLYDLYMDTLRDGQKALSTLENFVRDNPTSPYRSEVELKLGKVNEQLVLNFDEARRIYQRIIDTKENSPLIHEAYFRMGFVLREGYADYAGAIAIWAELINLYYQNEFAPEAQFATAFTYEAYLRDFTKARESYEKILNLYPNSPLQNQVREALLRIGGR